MWILGLRRNYPHLMNVRCYLSGGSYILLWISVGSMPKMRVVAEFQFMEVGAGSNCEWAGLLLGGPHMAGLIFEKCNTISLYNIHLSS